MHGVMEHTCTLTLPLELVGCLMCVVCHSSGGATGAIGMGRGYVTFSLSIVGL